MALWSAEIKELEKLYESLRGQFPDLEKEMEQLIRTEDANVILLYSRRCLELIITDLCECELKRDRGTEPLKGIIDKLNKEKKISAHIIASMHGLNELSTFGTHPKDFDPEQVKPVLVNLDIIIKWYLKYKNFKSVKEAPEQRELLEEVKKEERIEVQEKLVKSTKEKWLPGAVVIALLIITGIIAYSKLFKKDDLKRSKTSGERISVAVMPFQNMSSDSTLNYLEEWIPESVASYLSNFSEYLQVRQSESISSLIQGKGLTDYASITPSIASNISQKLDANVFISGGLTKSGSRIMLNAKLINSKTEEILRSFQEEGAEEIINSIIDTLRKRITDFLVISKLGEEIIPEIQSFASTKSPDACRDFILGNNAFSKRDYTTSVRLFTRALEKDSNFVFAAVRLSFAYYNLGLYDQSKFWCYRIYEKRDKMPRQLEILTNYVYAMNFETPIESIKFVKQLFEIDDQSPYVRYLLGNAYRRLLQFDKAIPEFEKALDIYKKWGSKPWWVLNYFHLGSAYHQTKQYNKEKELYKVAQQDFPDDPAVVYRQSVLSLTQADTTSANKYIRKYVMMRKDNLASEATISTNLANIYYEADFLDKAEDYYRKALSLEVNSSERMNTLAYFLVDKDRNVNEGMELVNKALEKNPDNYSYLHTKGWSLYKQGKYNEALEILQKSWDIRREQAVYDHEAYLHLEAAKKAVTN